MNAIAQDESNPNPWAHRLAWALACATFPLVWLGGLVTTYGAGMAVPDWPTTYGYWWYPLHLWGLIWDILLEHSHRVLAQTVGLLSIGLALVLWFRDRREHMRRLAVLLVAGVVFQGVLGGLRVLWQDLSLAKVHGCTAPLFFTLTAALVTLTSRRWRQGDAPPPTPEPETRPPQAPVPISSQAFRVVSPLLAGLIYVQVGLGVQLRQIIPDDAPGWFTLWVWLHVSTAILIAAAMVWVTVHACKEMGTDSEPMGTKSEKTSFGEVPVPISSGSATIVARRVRWLAMVLAVQLGLGVAVWVTKFGWPRWFTDHVWAVQYIVVAGGRLQVWARSLHTAVGSLSLATAAVLALWSRRT